MSKREAEWMTNLERVRQPQLAGKHWCASCDAALVYESDQCSVCGYKRPTKQKRNKK